jgi:hypothetical protein
VAAHVHAASAAPGQHRHHIDQLGFPRDAPARGHEVPIEAHLQPRTVVTHLIMDPLPGRTDAHGRTGRRRQRVPCPETRQLLDRRLQPLFRDRCEQCRDLRVGRHARLGGRGHRATGREDQRDHDTGEDPLHRFSSCIAGSRSKFPNMAQGGVPINAVPAVYSGRGCTGRAASSQSAQPPRSARALR